LRGWSGGAVTVAGAAVALLASSAYGVTDELHQHFVPGRDVTLGDLLADVIGAAAGASIAFALGRARPGATPPTPTR
jgi:VanZ family protein